MMILYGTLKKNLESGILVEGGIKSDDEDGDIKNTVSYHCNNDDNN